MKYFQENIVQPIMNSNKCHEKEYIQIGEKNKNNKISNKNKQK